MAAVAGVSIGLVGAPLLAHAPAAAAVTGPASAVAEQSDARLTWAPPELTKPVTYRVSGDGPGTIEARPGQDSIVVFDGPVHRRLRMDGGRHWVLRGGEIDNSKRWRKVEDQAGLQFQNVTGTAFVEGMLIHGEHGKDGIRVAAGGSRTTLIVQNSRIVERLAGTTGYHADIIQPFGGIRELKVDRLTGSGDYQGLMWKQERGTTFGPTDLRRVNLVPATPESRYMVNFVMSYPTQAVTLEQVYNEPAADLAGGDFCRAQVPTASATCGTDADGRQFVTWSGTPITVNGRMTEGPPPGGDFVPEGVAGLSYESPGYLEPAP